MVVIVAIHPKYPEICIYDLNEHETRSIKFNFIVMPWDTQNLDNYFKEISQLIRTTIDYLYIILNNTYLNDFRKEIIEISKKYNIKHCEIVSGFKEDAVIALKHIKHWPDSLWIFNCFQHGIYCALWETDSFNELRFLTFCYQRRTSQGDNPSSGDLQKLRNQIEQQFDVTPSLPALVVFQKKSRIDENVYNMVFNDYRNIFFHVTHSFTFSFVKAAQSLFLYKVSNILDRTIEIKVNNISICKLHCIFTTPIDKRYEVPVSLDNMNLMVYEDEVLTKEIPINETGIKIINIKIDANGIFTINFEKKTSIMNILNAINKLKVKENANFLEQTSIFYIPSKRSTYDAKLNAIGIDLGTSECCAFVIRRNGPDSVVLDSLTALRNLPSHICFEEFQTFCGQLAVKKMDRNSEFSIFDIKRLLGKSFNEIVIDSLWPFKVVDYYNQISLVYGSADNDTLCADTSVNLCSILLQHIKQKIDEYQGINSDETVITIPSTFTKKQKDATIEAALKAGWKSVHLLPEPIAAVIAYSYESDIPNESTVLLFDCGGGTIDICIAKIFDDKIQVITHTGDFFLGGKDFDKLIFNYFNSVLKHKFEVNVLETNKKLDVDDFKVDEDGIIKITRREFEEMAVDLILRTKNAIAESLRKVNLSNDNIDTIFQVGGGCRMPMIKKMLLEMFPKSQHQCSTYPEWMVAQGAALHAYSLKKS